MYAVLIGPYALSQIRRPSLAPASQTLVPDVVADDDV